MVGWALSSVALSKAASNQQHGTSNVGASESLRACYFNKHDLAQPASPVPCLVKQAWPCDLHTVWLHAFSVGHAGTTPSIPSWSKGLHEVDSSRPNDLRYMLSALGMQVQPHQDHQDQLPGHNEYAGPGQALQSPVFAQLHQRGQQVHQLAAAYHTMQYSFLFGHGKLAALGHKGCTDMLAACSYNPRRPAKRQPASLSISELPCSIIAPGFAG